MAGRRKAVRVVVVGTGAMACLVGARLARHGRARVTLLGTWDAALQAVARRGIVVDEEGGRWSAPVGVSRLRTGPPASDAPRGDIVMVLVKATATASVAEPAARAAGSAGLLVTLQNGLGNREVLEAAAGRGRVVAGAALFGATLLEPGAVRPTAGGVVLGPLVPDVERVADLLQACDIPTQIVPDIDRQLWRKLAVNCAINPISALLGVTNGALIEDAAARRTLADAAREVAEVATAAGVSLVPDETVELALSVARQTASNRSSMLQDLDRGAPTEVDALCGEVVRRGRNLGVPTPVNERLWEDVRHREADRRRQVESADRRQTTAGR